MGALGHDPVAVLARWQAWFRVFDSVAGIAVLSRGFSTPLREVFEARAAQGRE
jgi:hypothetical protein